MMGENLKGKIGNFKSMIGTSLITSLSRLEPHGKCFALKILVLFIDVCLCGQLNVHGSQTSE